MSAPWSLSGAKRRSGKLYSTGVSHNHSPSQLPYPPADFLPRSGLVQDRLHAVMTAQAATVEVLSKHDPKLMKMRDDIIKMAEDNERKQIPQRCDTIRSAFSILENSLKKRACCVNSLECRQIRSFNVKTPAFLPGFCIC
jgi:hypothetical protein